MAGLNVPDFIAEHPIGDYYKIGSDIWRAIYKKERQNAQVFKEDIWEDSGDGVFIINLKYISADQHKSSFEDLVNRLEPGVLRVPPSSSSLIVVHRDKFLDFIGQGSIGGKVTVKKVLNRLFAGKSTIRVRGA